MVLLGFCAENANGRTLTFHFEEKRLGCFGPAMSRNLHDWTWLGAGEENSFSYTFGEEESCVYFAHHMLYDMDRFYRLMQAHAIEIKELCKTKKGRSVPCAEFGAGEKTVIFTARHHACESTGDYVLEGVLEQLLSLTELPFRCVVVPFVDFDGVVDGDQGKGRLPHDHNRDYIDAPLYPETAAIMRLVKERDVLFGFDFHSPWHKGWENDTCFMVCNDIKHAAQYTAFGTLLESAVTVDAFAYRCENNHPFGVGWNTATARPFAQFLHRHGARLAFTLETAYFGTKENVFTGARAVRLGNCFGKALMRYFGFDK